MITFQEVLLNGFQLKNVGKTFCWKLCFTALKQKLTVFVVNKYPVFFSIDFIDV